MTDRREPYTPGQLFANSEKSSFRQLTFSTGPLPRRPLIAACLTLASK
jgi:hypothetical protein